MNEHQKKQIKEAILYINESIILVSDVIYEISDGENEKNEKLNIIENVEVALEVVLHDLTKVTLL